jgi:hypothetical protein
MQYKIVGTECLKVFVTETMLQKVTWADFDCAGVSTAFDPHYLRCFTCGAEVAIRVYGEDDNTFDAGDYVLFYGEAYENFWTDKNTYYLAAGGIEGKRMAERDVTAAGTPSGETSYTAVRYFEEDKAFINALEGNVEDHWLWQVASASAGIPSTTDFIFEIDNISTTLDNAAVMYAIQGYTNYTEEDPDHHITIYINGNFVAEHYYDGHANFECSVSISHSFLANGSNTFTIHTYGDTGTANDMSFLNYFELAYQRLYLANANEILFGCKVDNDHDVGGFSESDLVLADVTDTANPVFCTGFSLDCGTMTFYNEGERNYAAGSLDNLPRPECIKNKASTLNATSNTADYILITHADFMCASESLAAHREGEGMTVVIADYEDVCDEFSWGRKCPDAVHEFLKHAYFHWQQPPPEYVLLMGDASFDPKCNYGEPCYDFIPTRFLNMEAIYTACDITLADVTGTDCLSEFHMGRIPVDTAAEADTVVNKIITYENQGPEDWDNRVLLIAYVSEPINPFGCESDTLIPIIGAGYDIIKLYGDEHTPAYINTEINANLNNGVYISNYIGHAMTHPLGEAETLFFNWEGYFLTNGNKLHFFTSFSCSSANFTSYLAPNFRSVLECLLVNPTGGSVGCWGSSGMNYLIPQTEMNRELFHEIFEEGNKRIGPAVARAREWLASYGPEDPVVRDTLWCYVIIGDPALMLK